MIVENMDRVLELIQARNDNNLLIERIQSLETSTLLIPSNERFMTIHIQSNEVNSKAARIEFTRRDLIDCILSMLGNEFKQILLNEIKQIDEELRPL